MPLRRSEPPTRAALPLLAVALLWLTLPVVGPLDDHHFAERTHTHQHIYLDGRPVQHQHLVDSQPDHSHAGRLGSVRSNNNRPDERSVAFFTDSTTSFMLAVFHAEFRPAPERLRPVPPRGDGDNPLSPFTVRYQQPENRSIAPPLQPPIA
jgi:hypothetical protein